MAYSYIEIFSKFLLDFLVIFENIEDPDDPCQGGMNGLNKCVFFLVNETYVTEKASNIFSQGIQVALNSSVKRNSIMDHQMLVRSTKHKYWKLSAPLKL